MCKYESTKHYMTISGLHLKLPTTSSLRQIHFIPNNNVKLDTTSAALVQRKTQFKLPRSPRPFSGNSICFQPH